MANRGIRKPTYYAFKFFKDLVGKCVLKNDNCVICLDGDTYKGVVFNSRVARTGEAIDLDFSFAADASKYSLIKKLVDEDTCNPLKLWHTMGEPSSLTEEQIKLLKESDKPLIETEIIDSEDGKVKTSVHLNEYGLMYFELKPFELTSDRGYDYERVIK